MGVRTCGGLEGVWEGGCGLTGNLDEKTLSGATDLTMNLNRPVAIMVGKATELTSGLLDRELISGSMERMTG